MFGDLKLGRKLHPLDGFDAQQVEALLERAGGEVAEQQAAGAQGVGFGLQHGAVFEERGVFARQVEEVVGEVVGAVVGDDAVQGFAELEDGDGERAFGGVVERDRRRR